MFNFLSFN